MEVLVLRLQGEENFNLCFVLVDFVGADCCHGESKEHQHFELHMCRC